MLLFFFHFEPGFVCDHCEKEKEENPTTNNLERWHCKTCKSDFCLQCYPKINGTATWKELWTTLKQSGWKIEMKAKYKVYPKYKNHTSRMKKQNYVQSYVPPEKIRKEKYHFLLHQFRHYFCGKMEVRHNVGIYHPLGKNGDREEEREEREEQKMLDSISSSSSSSM